MFLKVNNLPKREVVTDRQKCKTNAVDMQTAWILDITQMALYWAFSLLNEMWIPLFEKRLYLKSNLYHLL